MKRTKNLPPKAQKSRKPRHVEVRKLVFRMLASPEVDARENVLAMQMHFEWIMSGKVPPKKDNPKPKLAAHNAP